MSRTPAELIARIEIAGSRHETPCGDGAMVWHRWGKGRPLVLLHGGSGSWRHWIRNIEALSANHEVWAPDMPGFGESSPPPPPVEFENISAAVVAGIRQLLPGEAPLDVMGFSFGSHTSQYVAEALGTRVGTLVLVNGHIMGELKVDPGAWMGRWRDVTDEAERTEIFRRNLAALMFADPANIDDLAMHLYAEDLPRSRVRPPRFIDKRDMRMIERLPCRIVNIGGERDPLAVPSVPGQQQMLRAARPDAEVHMVVGAGHWVAYEAADRFNALALAALG